ncbi:TAXI family TRAP transporter solute-binding subunit [Chloroflexota bacterium]
MRKLLVFTLVAMIIMLTACAKPAATPSPTPAPEGFDKIRIAGGYMGGSLYSISVGMMQIAKAAWGKDIRLSIEETGGGVDNVVRVGAGYDHMCNMSQIDLAENNNREGAYKDAKHDVTAAIIWPYGYHVFWYTTLDNKGWTARDLQGKTISNNTEGGMAYKLCTKALDASGITVTERNMTQSAGAKAVLEGTIVAHGTIVYASAWDEVAGRKGVWLVPPHPDDIPKILAKYPYFSRTKFIGSNYFKVQGGGNDIDTAGCFNCWSVRADMPDDLVYKLVKAAYENVDMLGAAYKPTGTSKPEDALQWVTKNSIHPGAAKYYREMGVNIPEELVYKK